MLGEDAKFSAGSLRLADGTLATRIDEKATELLNKGKLFDFDSSVVTSISSASVNKAAISFTSAGEVRISKLINSALLNTM